MKDILRVLREKNNLSQASVAEYLGVSRQMYMKYESGENEPTVKMVVLLSQLYKVSYEQIIDNRIDEKILVSADKSDYKMHSLESVCASPSPVYAADNNSTLDLLYIKKFSSLNNEQKTVVGNLIDSLLAVEKQKIYRQKKYIELPADLPVNFICLMILMKLYCNKKEFWKT